MTAKYIGFGFNPQESLSHFYILIPKDKTKEVEVYERFEWSDGEQKISKKDVLKIKFPRDKWATISREITRELNLRLKEEKKKPSRFFDGGTFIERLLGKELLVLLWSIENTDSSCIPTAIRNWKGLQPEERWWLYTMTNATGQINDKRGWRMALKYALCENPILEMPVPGGA